MVGRPILRITSLEVLLLIRNVEEVERQAHDYGCPPIHQIAGSNGPACKQQGIAEVVDISAPRKEAQRVAPAFVIGISFPNFSLQFRVCVQVRTKGIHNRSYNKADVGNILRQKDI